MSDTPGSDEAPGDMPDEPKSSVDERRIESVAAITRAGTWWEKVGGTYQFRLAVDGSHAAEIASSKVGSGKFKGIAYLRETEVRFDDGTSWEIFAEDPGPWPTRTTRFGRSAVVPYDIDTRVVVVRQGDQLLARRRIVSPEPARLIKNLVVRGRRAQVEAAGVRYDMSTKTGRRTGTIDRHCTIRPSGWGEDVEWSIETTAPIPLSVALLHWHLLLGDYATRGGA